MDFSCGWGNSSIYILHRIPGMGHKCKCICDYIFEKASHLHSLKLCYYLNIWSSLFPFFPARVAGWGALPSKNVNNKNMTGLIFSPVLFSDKCQKETPHNTISIKGGLFSKMLSENGNELRNKPVKIIPLTFSFGHPLN